MGARELATRADAVAFDPTRHDEPTKISLGRLPPMQWRSPDVQRSLCVLHRRTQQNFPQRISGSRSAS